MVFDNFKFHLSIIATCYNSFKISLHFTKVFIFIQILLKRAILNITDLLIIMSKLALIKII